VAVAPDEALDAVGQVGGVDTALEFVGRPEIVEMAVRCLDAGGTAVAVGIGSGVVQARLLMTFVVRERSLVGAYGNEPDEVREVLDLLAQDRLRLPHVVGDVIPLGDVDDGLARVARGDTGGSRIVLDIQAP
jgi:threonine dehydrogenase-like Zn-dependent dehydrogenase